MTAKPSRFFWIIFLVLLTACGNSQQTMEMTKVQNTALAIAQTSIARTQTAMPTVVLPPLTLTQTAIPTVVLPPLTFSPTPTPPIVPILIPDATQVARWKDYQTELANTIIPGFSDGALCEWDILGISGQNVYVWAICSSNGSDSLPAVIHLKVDGSVESVEVPMRGSTWGAEIQRLFPENIQKKIDVYFYLSSSFDGRVKNMWEHLEYRLTHFEEPPLIFIGKIPTATPTPTKPVAPLLTPNRFQIQRWKEYETVLATNLLYFLPSTTVLCEWEVLGQSGQDVYVWAICAGAVDRVNAPVVLHTEIDGRIQNIEIAGWDSEYRADVRRLFPPEVQVKILDELIDYHRLIDHLEWRKEHPGEPPLTVLNTMLTETPTP